MSGRLTGQCLFSRARRGDMVCWTVTGWCGHGLPWGLAFPGRLTVSF